MGERKVINHYFPPDFDPSKIPRRKRPKNHQVKVNMMIDMKLKCNVCSEYMNPGTKFNSRKETVLGEDYLGIKVYRFYIRCKNCYAELTFKTDPKNACYVAENNCAKIDMPWTLHARQVEQRQEELENADAIQMLEHKTVSGKKEMEDLDALQDLRDLQALNNKVSQDKLFELVNTRQVPVEQTVEVQWNEEEQVEEDIFVRRIEEDEQITAPKQQLETTAPQATARVIAVDEEVDAEKKRKRDTDVLLMVDLAKPKEKKKKNASVPQTKKKKKSTANALTALGSSYCNE